MKYIYINLIELPYSDYNLFRTAYISILIHYDITYLKFNYHLIALQYTMNPTSTAYADTLRDIIDKNISFKLMEANLTI